mgnify:CR=1 FL=1
MGNGVKTRNNFIVGGQTMKEQVFYTNNIKIVLKIAGFMLSIDYFLC